MAKLSPAAGFQGCFITFPITPSSSATPHSFSRRTSGVVLGDLAVLADHDKQRQLAAALARVAEALEQFAIVPRGLDS
jgi:hypothetical protein